MKVKELLLDFPTADVFGNEELEISSIVSFGDGKFSSNSITWLNQKNQHLYEQLKSGALILSSRPEVLNPEVTYIIFDHPRTVFKAALDKLFPMDRIEGIDATAKIHPSVKIGLNPSMGSNVVLEENVVIGDFVSIDHNSVLKKGTQVGNHSRIGANCTIGADGFGYQKNSLGQYEFIRHIGSVRIEEYVEIGNNTCIDRAVLGETLIESHVKIDNLVHIAHNCKIRKNSLIIANAMVGGSCEIGESTWVAPSSSIINGIQVGRDVTIGLGAVVLKKVEDGKIIVGNPGKELPPRGN